MPGVAGLPPRELRDVLAANGWAVIDETDHNWLLADSTVPNAEPVLVPKHGDVVDPEVMDSVCHRTGRLTKAIMDAVQRHVSGQP